MFRYGSLFAFCFSLISLFSQGTGKSWVVAKYGSGDFTSIQQAIDAVDSLGQNQTVIFIRNGVYLEKLFIAKSRITLRGQSEKAITASLTFDGKWDPEKRPID